METCRGHPVPWPHFYVFDYSSMRGAIYDDLSESEWFFGFIQIMLDSQWSDKNRYMLRYLGAFMEDVKDRPEEWVNLRSLHAMFLTLMEKKAIKWSSKTAIERLKTRFIYNRPEGASKAAQRKTIPLVACSEWNRGECKIGGSHSGVTHMCARCYKNGNGVKRHQENRCDSSPRKKHNF